MDFRWNEWNLEHATSHGVIPGEAEWIVRTATHPYPMRREEGKWLVWGRGRGGRLLQVVFLEGEDERIYIIHARPLTEKESHRFRKRQRE